MCEPDTVTSVRPGLNSEHPAGSRKSEILMFSSKNDFLGLFCIQGFFDQANVEKDRSTISCGNFSKKLDNKRSFPYVFLVKFSY